MVILHFALIVERTIKRQSRFCVSCGAGVKRLEDSYTTEPLDPSVVFRERKVGSKSDALALLLSQAAGWELKGLERDQVDVIMQTLSDAVALWQWLWYYYGKHPGARRQSRYIAASAAGPAD